MSTLRSIVLLMLLFALFEVEGREEDLDLVVVVAAIPTGRIPGEGRWGGHRGQGRVGRRRGLRGIWRTGRSAWSGYGVDVDACIWVIGRLSLLWRLGGLHFGG